LIYGAIYRCIALAFHDHRISRPKITTFGIPTAA
jgi:hypothetical protein